MFNVPGWSLPQTPIAGGKSAGEQKNESNKRKRKEPDPTPSIAYPSHTSTGGNVKQGGSRHNGQHGQDQKKGRKFTAMRGWMAVENDRKLRDPTLPLLENDEGHGRGIKKIESRMNAMANLKRPASSTTMFSSETRLRSSSDTGVQEWAGLTPLQLQMHHKLKSAHFRHLNETLYSLSSSDASQLFQSDPQFYHDYHVGFRQQVARWPDNPSKIFISDLFHRSRMGVPTSSGHREIADTNIRYRSGYLQNIPLPSRRNLCCVADLGCGDAEIAQQISKTESHAKVKIKVDSYDLQASNQFVTVADISRLPVSADKYDICIFCLSLMGTNWLEYIDEASRILQPEGELWIAETKSRFAAQAHPEEKRNEAIRPKKQEDKKTSKLAPNGQCIGSVEFETARPADCDLTEFLQVLERRNFILPGEQFIDYNNKMFVTLVLKTSPHIVRQGVVPVTMTRRGQNRVGNIDLEKEARVLRPCVYKNR